MDGFDAKLMTMILTKVTYEQKVTILKDKECDFKLEIYHSVICMTLSPVSLSRIINLCLLHI